MPAHPLLYVHPCGHLNDLVVPAGALASLNAVAAPKLGRYAFEVTAAEIAGARVVAVDLHWALGADGFSRLVRHVRDVNPRAAIVAGGITAGIHARTLVDELGVDFVVRGDSERDFAALCTALLEGRDPDPLPNVVARGRPDGFPERMTREQFDATDCVTAGWFPTYDRVSDWDAAAFSMARTIPVLRGCPMRCEACYGSYAASMGAGHLVRSPASLVREVGRAAAAGVRNLRLVVAKPPPPILRDLLGGLARAGPFRLPSTVGLFLCSPPSDDDLAAVEETFPGGVALSVVPPDEHEPPLPPERLHDEEEAWRRASRRVARSTTLRLDVWRTAGSDTRRARDVFGAGPRVTVSLGTTWHVLRARAGAGPPLSELREVAAPLWTFYAARLLSPALASLLEPFRFLDELDRDPEHLPRPDGPLGGWHDVAIAGWRAHRLPTLPGLGFGVLPFLRGDGPLALARLHAGVRFHGPAGAVTPGLSPSRGAIPVPVRIDVDHATVWLRSGPLDAVADSFALVPHLAPPSGAAPATLPLDAFGGVVLAAPRPVAGVEVRVALRIQEAGLTIVDARGKPLARARAELGYFTPRHRARAPGRG